MTGIYWVVPESVRWLLANGRVEEAKRIIERAEKENKQLLPTQLLDKLDKSISQPSETKHQETASMMDVLRNPRILLRTVNMCYQVISSSCVRLIVVTCPVVQCHPLLLWSRLRQHQSLRRPLHQLLPQVSLN